MTTLSKELFKHGVSKKNLVFVGSFTTAKRKACGKGIDVYRVNPHSGSWFVTDHASDIVNPTVLHVDQVREVLYVAHGDADFVSAFEIDGSTGKLRLLGQAATGGQNGVSASLDPSGRFLLVANYSSGSVSVLPVREDGAPEPFSHCFEVPQASGPHRTEQTMPHPHDVVFDPSGCFLLIPDKGADRVLIVALDATQGQLRFHGHAAMRAGSGPCRIVFHPKLPRAFVLNEIDSTVVTCRWNGETGKLIPLHVVSALLPDLFGASAAAEIVVTPCGRFVYVSNRGYDAVTHLEFDEAGDRLNVVGWTPTQGRDPRFMTLSPQGDCLLVANVQGNNIVAFGIDLTTGNLSPSDFILTSASPCAIAFL